MKVLNYLFFNMFGSLLECCELTGASLLWTRMAWANKAKIGLVFQKLGIYHGVYLDCIIIINLKGYIDLLDTSIIVFVNNSLWFVFYFMLHYGDVIMTAIVSQITSLTIVYSTGYSDVDQRKHQSSASLAIVRGIQRGPVNPRANGQ